MVEVVVETFSRARTRQAPQVRITRRQLTGRTAAGAVPLEDSIVVDVSESQAKELVGSKKFGSFQEKQEFIQSLQQRSIPFTPGTAVSGEVSPAFTREEDDTVTPREVRAAGIIRQRPEAFEGEAPITATREEIQQVNIEREQARLESLREGREQAREEIRAEEEVPSTPGERIRERLRERDVTTFRGEPIAGRPPGGRIPTTPPPPSAFMTEAEEETPEEFEAQLQDIPGATIPIQQPTLGQETIPFREEVTAPQIDIPPPITTLEEFEVERGILGSRASIEEARQLGFGAEFRQTGVARLTQQQQAFDIGIGAGIRSLFEFPLELARAPKQVAVQAREQVAEFITTPPAVTGARAAEAVRVAPSATLGVAVPVVGAQILGVRSFIGGLRRPPKITIKSIDFTKGVGIEFPSGAAEAQAAIRGEGLVGVRPFRARLETQIETVPSIERVGAQRGVRRTTAEIDIGGQRFLGKIAGESILENGIAVETIKTTVAPIGRKGKIGRPRKLVITEIISETEELARVTSPEIDVTKRISIAEERTLQGRRVSRAAGIETVEAQVLPQITELGEPVRLTRFTGVGAVEDIGGLEDFFLRGRVAPAALRQARRKIPKRKAPSVEPSILDLEPTPTRRPSRPITPEVGLEGQALKRPTQKGVRRPATITQAELDIRRIVSTAAKPRVKPPVVIPTTRISQRQIQDPILAQATKPSTRQQLQIRQEIRALPRQQAALGIIQTPRQKQVQATGLDIAGLAPPTTRVARGALARPGVIPTLPVGLPIPTPPIPFGGFPFGERKRARITAPTREKPGAPGLFSSVTGLVGEKPKKGKKFTGFEFRPITKEARSIQDLFIRGGTNGRQSKKTKRNIRKKKTTTKKK